MNLSSEGRRFPVILALAVASMLASPVDVFGMATEDRGNAPFGERNYEAWKGKDIMPVINHPSRVYHVWVNGNEHFYYRGDTEALNDVLRKFAAVKLEVREVVFLAGPAETSPFHDEKLRYDWQVHLLTGLAGRDTPSGAEMDVGERNPTLTVFVGEGNVVLDEVRIPEGITFVGPTELRKRYLKALKSNDGDVRGYAAYRLAELEPYNKANLPLIVGLLEDKDAGWTALGALAKMGKTAEEALPAISQALKKRDEGWRKRALEVIEEIRGAKDTTEAARVHGEVVKLISNFQENFAVTFPELTPEQTQQAQALIKELSAPEFAVRQEAVKKLIQIGPDVVPLVRKSLAETEDEEMKFRCQMVLKGIREKYGVSGESEKRDTHL